MKFSIPHSTPKCGLHAAKQAAWELEDSQSFSGEQFSQQLCLPLDALQNPAAIPLKKRQKPQISCIPGISLTSCRKYRVMLGGEVLGDRLTLEQALEVAGGGR